MVVVIIMTAMATVIIIIIIIYARHMKVIYLHSLYVQQTFLQ